jgi:hypothetical protein
MSFGIATLKQRPNLEEQAERMNGEGWPTFLLHGDVAHWDALFDDFAEYQVLFCDPAETLIALGHTVPFVWDGTPKDLPCTMSEIMERALRIRRDLSTPNTLSALAALVTPSHQRPGLSAGILRTMRSLAEERDIHALVAPVRPTLKSSYPLTPLNGTLGGSETTARPSIPGSESTGDSAPNS